MPDHDNPGNPEMVSGDALLNFLKTPPAPRQVIQVNIPQPIEVPPLLDRTSYFIITGAVALGGSIVLGSLGVPLPIIVGGAFVGTLVLNRIATKRGWV